VRALPRGPAVPGHRSPPPGERLRTAGSLIEQVCRSSALRCSGGSPTNWRPAPSRRPWRDPGRCLSTPSPAPCATPPLTAKHDGYLLCGWTPDARSMRSRQPPADSCVRAISRATRARVLSLEQRFTRWYHRHTWRHLRAGFRGAVWERREGPPPICRQPSGMGRAPLPQRSPSLWIFAIPHRSARFQ